MKQWSLDAGIVLNSNWVALFFVNIFIWTIDVPGDRRTLRNDNKVKRNVRTEEYFEFECDIGLREKPEDPPDPS